MVGVQKKFFQLLDEAADKHGLQVVISHDWSNTGTLHLQRSDSFHTVLSLPYNFQHDRVSFGWMGGASYGDNPPVFKGRPNPWFAGFKPSELDEAIDAIVGFQGKVD